MHGDGPSSDSVSILAATIPSQMASPKFSQFDGSFFKCSITAPGSGGNHVLITAYEI